MTVTLAVTLMIAVPQLLKIARLSTFRRPATPCRRPQGSCRLSRRQVDLSGLPSYKPQQQVTGVIRMTGSNYIADSHVGENWVAAFKKFQPGVTFEFNLKTPSAAVYALFSMRAMSTLRAR